MIAASRRWAKLPPWQAASRRDSSTLVKTGTAGALTADARIPVMGSRRPASAASHLKNCCSVRNWMLA